MRELQRQIRDLKVNLVAKLSEASGEKATTDTFEGKEA
jgi:hypothetical protein